MQVNQSVKVKDDRSEYNGFAGSIIKIDPPNDPDPAIYWVQLDIVSDPQSFEAQHLEALSAY